jgi:hypothetical protein
MPAAAAKRCGARVTYGCCDRCDSRSATLGRWSIPGCEPTAGDLCDAPERGTDDKGAVACRFVTVGARGVHPTRVMSIA